MGMSRQFLASAAAMAFGALALIGTTAADASSQRQFRDCLATKPVRFEGTIVDAALATPELSALVDLVVAANLVDALGAPGNLTVFAPTNDAFAAVPAPVLGAIGSDIDILTSVLTHHVAPRPVDPRIALIPTEVKSLQGQALFLDYDSGPQINQSNTSCQAVRTNNGTVWLIDSVLLPQFLQ
jgi:uncharacterized surface protein with fasciclin (FAS1) repeats